VTFDPIAWATSLGVAVGLPPIAAAPIAPAVGAVEVDEPSRAAWVDEGTVAVAVEGAIREHGLTLGLFPETYECASVGQLVAADAPGAGASGRGFASLVLARSEGRLLLACRPRPAAQAGRGLVFASFADGVAGLRALAQAVTVPEIALVADPAESALLLALAGAPDLEGAPLGDGSLAIVIVAGDPGETSIRLEQKLARPGVGGRECGQNVARAWASSRYETPRVARALAAAGVSLETTWRWHPWSAYPDVLEQATEGDHRWTGRQVLGAGPHGATLVTRTLS
jgi:alkyldihydroxyacetonephosphate synthase